tara:strand:- start:503 stop:670 length:168 start_codon:yes stop_codon:yes gene_type:complete
MDTRVAEGVNDKPAMLLEVLIRGGNEGLVGNGATSSVRSGPMKIPCFSRQYNTLP